MTKKTLAPILALALLAAAGGTLRAAQPVLPDTAPDEMQECLQAPSPDRVEPEHSGTPEPALGPVVEPLPMHHGGGYCAIVSTKSVQKCKEYCYLQTTCGFHHYSNGTCYCGGDKL
jgi:hypothetical protein